MFINQFARKIVCAFMGIVLLAG
ncbi:MAG: hypothetical protein K0Q90_1431, partial [Paenibacillaceae bacterium]|nr:hypothetical protein [Paenibacillaceae bacterium]